MIEHIVMIAVGTLAWTSLWRLIEGRWWWEPKSKTRRFRLRGCLGKRLWCL